ncbi:MAG: hypothetical protein RRB13_03610 [bacterium]|nr:hypothetical protein [bacterium]
MSLLITAAIAAELEPLASHLGAQAIEGGWQGDGLILAPLGIGPLEAALGLTKWAQEGVDQVIFTGSAGVYPGVDLEVGQLVAADWTTLYDGAAVLGQAHFALLQDYARLKAGPESYGLERVGVATGLAVTRSRSLGQALAQATGAEVENLELYGLALAAARLGLLWSSVLGITNRVEEGSQDQWKQNYPRLAQSVCNHLADWLAGPAERLSKR